MKNKVNLLAKKDISLVWIRNETWLKIHLKLPFGLGCNLCRECVPDLQDSSQASGNKFNSSISR